MDDGATGCTDAATNDDATNDDATTNDDARRPTATWHAWHGHARITQRRSSSTTRIHDDEFTTPAHGSRSDHGWSTHVRSSAPTSV